MDREDVVERVNWSPRGDVSIGVLPEGRGILRGGVGRFRQRTPLNVGAFGEFESRVATRFGPDGGPLGPPVTFVNVPASDLRTPEAVAGNVEWNQRFGRRVLFKVNYLKRSGSHEYIVEPDPSRGELRLMSTGRTFDFSISRPWHVWKYQFRGGIKVYNIFGASAERDVQTNVTSPSFGQFFNPLERSIGFVLLSAK